ncbi:acyltransferase [Trichoderma harzianum]|uniref:Acyltransferase n=1 Tax=Trichoderma harzianum TaxID=5544 RepID=A0A0F9XAQ9_TRIHA|nr:acyltransferase [Trichoderma harzianum]
MPGPSHRSLITHVRGILLTAPWFLYLFLADVALSLLLPLKPLAPELVYNLSSRLAGSVWSWLQFIFQRVNGARIVCSGDELPPGESAIVVANHRAWSDFYMIQALAIRSGMLGRCRYFAKRQLRFVPFLGWGLWAMGMPMVSRSWRKDKSGLDRAFAGLVSRRLPTWLISFSEATRFSQHKYQESLAWCKKTDRPHPMHLLYPRTKGFITTVQHLREAPHIKAVYDVTILYRRGSDFQEVPTMWDTLSIPSLSKEAGYAFHVHTRRFPIETLPYTDAELARWLEQRWIEKGEWLEAQRQKCLTRKEGPC